MPETEVQLTSLFNAVTRVLKENKDTLNEADTYNHNHGDNMVKNFKVISKALKETQGESASVQLAHASEILSQKSNSGSAQMYSQGLARAAQQLQGQKSVNSENAMSLVQALLGGEMSGGADSGVSSDMVSGLLGSLMGGSSPISQGVSPSGSQSDDLLGGLMGSLLGGTSPMPQASQDSGAQSADMLSDLLGSLQGSSSMPQGSQSTGAGSPDMLSGLLGSLLGGGSSGQSSQFSSDSESGSGLNLNTLLTAGLAYMQASQQGAKPLEALVQAVMAGSQMNTTAHHSQSGSLVASTLISTLGKILGGK